MGDFVTRLKRLLRQQRLARRLRRASGRPTVSAQFRSASIIVALCMAFVLAAQFVHASSRAQDRAVLAQAREIEELAHKLTAASAKFHVAAIDLINEANAGPDSPDRQREMIAAVEKLKENFGKLRANASAATPVGSSAALFDRIDEAAAFVLMVDSQDALKQRELVEEKVGDFATKLDVAIEETEAWAVGQRRTYVAQLERTDQIARIVIIAATAIALGVGLYFYRRLVHGVFPATNHLRQVIVAMANGRLDNELPDQQYREPQQMTLALRKLRAAARREQQYARIDFLTDLPNRRALAHELVEWPRERPGCVFIVDVDGFKLVNDSFGHPVGDELIRRIADRLQEVAPAKAVVARLGGDEFAILAPLRTSEEFAALGSKIVATCAEPINALGTSLSISVSVGIAPLQSSNDRGLELAEVLRPADLALYSAKANGRNGFALYTPDMRVSADFLHLIESDLDAAIGKGQLHLVFQPIIDVHGVDNEVEALVRWNHPELGAVSPEQLIEVAERSGQMERLGHWIIDAALDALVEWPTLSMSLNLSPRQLRVPGFAAMLTAQCRERGIAAPRVILEITESVAVDDVDRMILMLSLLQTVGFRVALDDFGKGYSSLWMLKQFAFNRIKIDRSLVEDFDNSPQARAILVAAVNMSRDLGMEVVAEGIDKPALAAQLSAIGCTHLQGYSFSRPLEQDAVVDYYSEPPRALRIAS